MFVGQPIPPVWDLYMSHQTWGVPGFTICLSIISGLPSCACAGAAQRLAQGRRAGGGAPAATDPGLPGGCPSKSTLPCVRCCARQIMSSQACPSSLWSRPARPSGSASSRMRRPCCEGGFFWAVTGAVFLGVHAWLQGWDGKRVESHKRV